MSLRLPTLLFASLPLLASAQRLTDPTRPPPEAMLPQSGNAAPAAPAGPQLQSVLVGKGYQGREVAVIDGEILRRGDKFHGAVLEEVKANEVILRRGKQVEVLHLFPMAASGQKTKSENK